MLSLSTLHTTLAHILAPPHLHTAILFTTSGQLISYASDHPSDSSPSSSSSSPNVYTNNSYNRDNNPPSSSNPSLTSKSPSSTLKPTSASSTCTASETEEDAGEGAVRGVGVGTGGALGLGGGVIGARRGAGSRGSRSKDGVRVLVGLGSELWGETKGAGVGMVDSELGRIVVVPILALPSASPSALPSTTPTPSAEAQSTEDSTTLEIEIEKDTEKKDAPDAPLMLLALNGTDDVSWDEMRSKAKSLATHLAPPLSKYREYLVVAHPPLPLTGGVVPPGGASVSATGGGGGVPAPAPARAVNVGGRT